MNGATVYVVQAFEDDGHADDVVGVFSTRDLAEQAAERARKWSRGWPVEVTEMTVDKEVGE